MPRHRRGQPPTPFIDFEFLKRSASFEAVLAHYGCHLGRVRRDETVINCPLPAHEDTTPSCSINLAKKQFHCFGCDEQGSILDFVALMEELDPHADRDLRAAASTLASICSLPLSDRSKLREKGAEAAKMEIDSPSRSKTRSRGSQREIAASQRDTLLDWHEPALMRNEPRPAPLGYMVYDHAYLAHRGLSPALAEELEIGFYEGKGLMRDRITVAIRDWWEDGSSNLVAYLGRWPDDEPPEGELRWKFPEGFKKTHVLYNLHRLAGQARHVYLVEGPFDCVRLHRDGEPAAALLGHAISPEQVDLLRLAGIRFVTVLLDGDEPGRRAAPKVVAMLAHGGLYSRILYLPDGTDPANVDDARLEALLHRTSWP